MPRTAVAPKPGVRKQIPFKLDAADAIDLHAFCEASYGAKQNRVLAEAWKRFLETELARDPQFRERFLDAKERLLRANGFSEGLRLVRDAAPGQRADA